jgi:hypothetical protein
MTADMRRSCTSLRGDSRTGIRFAAGVLMRADRAIDSPLSLQRQ